MPQHTNDLKRRAAKYMQREQLVDYQNQVRTKTLARNNEIENKVSETEGMDYPRSKHLHYTNILHIITVGPA